MHLEKEWEKRRGGDKEKDQLIASPCLPIFLSPCLTGSVAHVRQQRHKPRSLDRASNRVLARRVAARLATAHYAAMPVGQLREQVEIFVINVHRPRRVALNVNRIALRDLLHVLVALVAVVTIVLIRRHRTSAYVRRLRLGKLFESKILNDLECVANRRFRSLFQAK
jgi:hypothetical protein